MHVGDDTSGAAEYAGIKGIRGRDGLFVGPAMGFVGAFASDSVTVRLWPFHPFVDNRSRGSHQIEGDDNIGPAELTVRSPGLILVLDDDLT